MATFGGLDVALYTVVFLVPGFVASAVLALLVPRRVRPSEVRFLEFLTLSCLNHAFWLPLVSWSIRRAIADGNFAPLIWLYVPTFLSPIVLGLLLGWAMQADWFTNRLRSIGFRTVHQIPTAWDYHFSRQQPYWVIVTLTDGSRVFGLYGYRSFAGDEATERDLYLEQQFVPSDDGEWIPINDSAGILLKADRIAAIEFREYLEISNGTES